MAVAPKRAFPSERTAARLGRWPVVDGGVEEVNVKKSNAMLEKENKELRRKLEDTEDRRRSGEGRGDNLRTELDASRHELVHFKQTVRSLHLALNVVTRQLQKHQKEAGQFAGSNSADEELVTWSKALDSLALAK